MDEQRLLTWFEQIEGRISQTFIPGTHQYAMRTALLTEMQTALESVFPPSHTVLRRWEDVRSRESQALQNDHGSRLEFAQDELIAIFRVAHRLLRRDTLTGSRMAYARRPLYNASTKQRLW